jgi:hypothetical protein
MDSVMYDSSVSLPTDTAPIMATALPSDTAEVPRTLEVHQALTRLAKAECTLEALVQVLVASSHEKGATVREVFEDLFPTAFTDIAYREGYAPYLKDVEAAAVEAYFDITGDLA